MLTSTSRPLLAPNDLARYAEFHGWTRGAPYGEDSHIYVSGSGEMIVLPTNNDAHDYESLADQAVRALADLSDTDPRTIYDEIKRFDRDVIRIQVSRGEDEGKSINLANGKSLINGAWRVMKALADEVEKSEGLEEQWSQSLLEGFRLEERDSSRYAVEIIAPPLPHTWQWRTLAPPQRHLSERFARALITTRQLADQYGHETIESDAHKVVSTAWLDGLADVVEPFDEVEVGLTWARTAPLQQAVNATFNAGDLQVLRALAGRLQQDETLEEYRNVNITGYVEVLKHPNPVNSQRTVTIKAGFNAKDITVSAVLNADDYNRACRANESKSNVVVSGSRLFKAGRSWVLEGAQLRAVIPSIGEDTMSKDQPRMALST